MEIKRAEVMFGRPRSFGQTSTKHHLFDRPRREGCLYRSLLIIHQDKVSLISRSASKYPMPLAVDKRKNALGAHGHASSLTYLHSHLEKQRDTQLLFTVSPTSKTLCMRGSTFLSVSVYLSLSVVPVSWMQDAMERI